MNKLPVAARYLVIS